MQIDLFNIMIIIARWFLFIGLGLYLIMNLQWYNYKLYRVIFHHKKRYWHIFLFVIPFIYFIAIPRELYFYIPFYTYFFVLLIWLNRATHKLSFTLRVWRFLGIYIGLLALFELILWLLDGIFSSIFSGIIDNKNIQNSIISILYILPICATLFITSKLEKWIMDKFNRWANAKLRVMRNLTVILVTGSYGKTSIKNYLYEILKTNFNVYATPKSVNTINGIIADVNNNLDTLTDIYIVEAGARGAGDIKEIADLVRPHIAVIGKIGEAHIEYFKTLNAVYAAKYEALQSDRLTRAYIHAENEMPKKCPVAITEFPRNVKKIVANLDGTKFTMQIGEQEVDFNTKLLGAFNVANISAAIAVASDFGLDRQSIVRAVEQLEAVPHRLNKIVAGDKIILDDSYNGNIEGMLEAVRLCSLHKGRKIIVTPGLVESRDELNIELAERIDEVFDVAVITGELNSEILRDNIKKIQKIALKDRNGMEGVLKMITQGGDIILFANDAPNYI